MAGERRCLQCDEEGAKWPAHEPTFCSPQCARLWAYEYAPATFYWHSGNQVWYSKRQEGEFPDGDLDEEEEVD